MDSENGFASKKQTTTSEGTNDENVVFPQHKISMFSSSSSEFYTLEQLKEANLEVVSSPEVSGSGQEPMRITKSSGGSDRKRIPSSLFASKPGTSLEWSVTSNESLFSIHMGNNSFSNYQAFMLYKSGELTKLDDMHNTPPSLLPVLVEQTLEKKMEEMNKGSKVAEEKPVEPAKMEPEFSVNNSKTIPEETKKNVCQEKATPDDLRNSSSRTHSFHFPALETNGAGNVSVKVVMDKQTSKKQTKQESQPQTPVTPAKPNGKSWFSCFSCCSLGC